MCGMGQLVKPGALELSGATQSLHNFMLYLKKETNKTVKDLSVCASNEKILQQTEILEFDSNVR